MKQSSSLLRPRRKTRAAAAAMAGWSAVATLKTMAFVAVVAVASLAPLFSVDAAVRRQGNLDHLDAETLGYYMVTKDKMQQQQQQPRHDYDLVVMFYAPWCTNCHSLANIYDQISKLLKATTSKKSKLLMGLFNCEADADAAAACTTARVTGYPTVAYLSLAGGGGGRSGGTQPHRLSKKEPYNMVHFEGNWQYGEAIMDWIKSMQWLSRWHRAAWGKRLRSVLFFGAFDDKKSRIAGGGSSSDGLPMGIPPAGGATATGTIPSSPLGGSPVEPTASKQGPASAVDESTVLLLQQQNKEYKETLDRSKAVTDALFNPLSLEDDARPKTAATTLKSGGNKTYTDAFAYLNQTNRWEITSTASTTRDAQALVLSTCVLGMTLEYCQRVTERVARDWVQEQQEHTSLEDLTEQVAKDEKAVAERLLKELALLEPYCGILDECVQGEMRPEKCRPNKCPFADEIACRSMTACFSKPIQQEYADALQVVLPSSSKEEESDGGKTSTTSNDNSSNKKKTDKGGGGGLWGLK